MDYIIINGELCHHGVKGMKWGVRRAAKKQARLERRLSNKSKSQDGADVDKRVRAKQTAKIAAAAVGGALATIGIYKLTQVVKDKYFSHYMSVGMRSAEKLMSQGYGDRALNNLRESIDYHRNVSATQAIKRVISNNSVNGKVDWGSVRKIFK